MWDERIGMQSRVCAMDRVGGACPPERLGCTASNMLRHLYLRHLIMAEFWRGQRGVFWVAPTARRAESASLVWFTLRSWYLSSRRPYRSHRNIGLVVDEFVRETDRPRGWRERYTVD